MKTSRMKYIGVLLRSERRMKDKTLAQVAEEVGLKENTISAYEKGKIQIPIDNLEAYCHFLGIDYINLLQRAEELMSKENH